MSIECLIVHDIPGRVRLRVSSKAAVRENARTLERFILADLGATAIRINMRCSSLIVQYDPVSLQPRTMADTIATFLSQRWLGPAGTGQGTHATATKASRGLVAGKGHTSKGVGQDVLGLQEPGRWLDRPRAWHGIDVDEVARVMGSDTGRGLDAEEADTRLAQHGRNALGEITGRSRWSVLSNQFASLPVALLLGSAVVSITTAGLADAIVILGVVTINACIGYVSESQAEQTIASLHDERKGPALVIRGGYQAAIAPESLVPGDLVLLTPGMTVFADLRLLKTQRLMMDESALTGESMPIEKSPARLVGETVALRDRCNMAYRGTVVTGGSGTGMVVATGPDTEVGQIQRLVGTAKAPETPVQRQLGQLGTQLGVLTGAVCGGVFAAGLLRRYGTIEMLKTATSLAVAAVPEGLPMVATTTLALGVNRMRRLKVAVRRLDAVETLGSVDVFCFDKTGTLTENQMRVVRLVVGSHPLARNRDGGHFDVESEPSAQHQQLRRLLEVIVLCNEAEIDPEGESTRLEGSPTETALIRCALEFGFDAVAARNSHRLLRTQYRDEQRSYMMTTHRLGPRRRLLAVKGRPGDVLELCRWKLVDEARLELTDEDREEIRTENELMAGKSLRVLGFAFGERDENRPKTAEPELTWLGLAGIADPVRPGMRELMRTFHSAGIRTTMITGDQSATAHAVGRELNLGGGPGLQTMDSADLETIDADVLKGLAANVDVFSSVTPTHKLQIVQALQRGGMIVAMTGDGINDGPALRAADIGVAMGGDGATDVARMTADVVLEDNNLRSMISAISQGRAIYSNTRNAIEYLLSTNLSEIMVMSTGILSGVGTPLNPMQLLWINLVSDIFPVLALAVQPPEGDVLTRPPRDASEPFIDRGQLKPMLVNSSIISAGTFASYAWGRRRGSSSHAGTMAFMSITIAQLLHMLASRSERRTIFSAQQPPTNPLVSLGLVAGCALQLITVTSRPLRTILRNTPLGPVDLAISFVGAAIPFVVNEAIKERQLRPSGQSPSFQSNPHSN